MDRKTLIAFVIIGLLFLLLPSYYKLVNPPAEKSANSSRPDSSIVSSPAIPNTVLSAQGKTTLESDSSQLQAAISQDSNPPREVLVETDLYSAKFSTRGAALISFVLKKYHKANNAVINLVQNGDEGTLRMKGESDYLIAESSNYIANIDSIRLSVVNVEDSLTFVLESPDGQSIRKTYHFNNGEYSIRLDIALKDISKLGCTNGYYLCWDAPLPITEVSASKDNDYMKGYAMFGGESLDFKDSDGGKGLREEKSGETNWVASKSKYFASAIVCQSRKGSGFYIDVAESLEHYGEETIKRRLITNGLKMAPSGGNQMTDNFLIYVGPIDYYILQSYNVGLETIVEMGWKILQPFSRILLWLLVQLHRVIPNYGFVLILFSIFIKVALYPLSRKSTASMSKMQEVSPKIQELRDKHKNDPKKLNTEVMKLYKEHGVNPVGGCLPLVLQMPLFFALYQVLNATIELRGANFILWIKDLSQQDPFYILPVLMGITMFVQQKMTMKDPKQQMMVYLMPGVMTFVFLKMPAGLVLYWTMFNILSFAEQLYIKRRSRPSPTVVVT